MSNGSAIERFRRLVAERLGLQLDGPLAGAAEAVLARRSAARGLAPEVWLARMESATPPDEAAALARELTINETYFFRDLSQFHALEALAAKHAAGPQGARPLRVLSAGCASGEEAYSIAMTLSQVQAAQPRLAWRVLAVDANPAVLDKARRARYTPWALREVPPTLRQRWFGFEGAEVTIDEAIRRAVRFDQRNLSQPDAELWATRSWDVVFCRNMLMYLTRPAAAALVARIAHALEPEGVLFLGHAETLRGLCAEFEPRELQGSFCWRRRSEAASGSVPAAGADAAYGAPARARRGDAGALAQGSHGAGLPPRPVVPGQAAADASLAQAFERFAQERFDDALRLVQALPEAVARTPDARLLQAVLLVHGGRFGEAARACAGLLERQPADAAVGAEAHHVLALCRERAGDLHGAAECDRRAAALDPSFAMPCLHLGLLARRAGDEGEARSRLAQAAGLLEREPERRLRLFGGGFGRAALIGLCGAEGQAA